MKNYSFRILLGWMLSWSWITSFSQSTTSAIDLNQIKPLVNLDFSVEHLSRAISFPTVSYHDTAQIKYSVYQEFLDYLEKSYPMVHKKLGRELINRYSMLYTWIGSDTTLSPILLLGHYDVVPVDSNSIDHWKEEPFSGKVDSEFIWGRGAIDNKFQVISLLEAAEQLLMEGFIPERTICFAFGHDEEVGGENGALQISKYLQNKYRHFEMILDEGGGVTVGIYPGIQKSIAFIATAEKGAMNVELSVRGTGGHSSAPPRESAITILSSAILKINSKPMPLRLAGPVSEMLESLKSNSDWKTRLAVNNKWLFRKKILKEFSKNQASNALVRTVISPTIIRGGVKENSIPGLATANLNVRLLPGDNVKSVIDHIVKTVGDNRVSIKLNGPFSEASPISSITGNSFKLLKKLINLHFPDALVAPALTIVATDTRHYTSLSHNIFRFTPAIITNEDKEIVHGCNERIAINNYIKSIRFYYDLMKENNCRHKK